MIGLLRLLHGASVAAANAALRLGWFRRVAGRTVRLIALLVVPWLAACTEQPGVESSSTEASAAAQVVDGRGVNVRVSRPPTRLVSLAPSTTEILYAVGAGGRLVRRDDHSDYPPEVLSLESIGATHPTVNAESIVAAKPDLVLAAGSNDLASLERLEAVGVTVYAAGEASGFGDLYQDIRNVGRLCGVSESAVSLVASLKARVARVAASRPAEDRRPTVFFVLDSGDSTRPWTCGKGSFIDEVFRVAGARNIAGAEDGAYFQMSLERLVSLDPRFILRCGRKTGLKVDLSKLAGWNQLSAVREGRVFETDENLLVRPGPRLVDGLEAVARFVNSVREGGSQ
ncbi:MAG: ABC transporter substrate-binding protein [Planctomycetota bacterium]